MISGLSGAGAEEGERGGGQEAAASQEAVRGKKRSKEKRRKEEERGKKKKKTDKNEEVKKKEKKPAEKKKKKGRKVSSSSSSSASSNSVGVESSVESSDSSMSSDDDSSSQSSSSESEKKRKKGKKASREQVNWDLINEMWPRDQRPKHLQKKKIVNSLSLGKLLQYKEHYEKEAEKKGLGSAVFGKDMKIRKTKYKKMTDDGQTKLHPARFSRLPLAPPRKYWKQVPKRRANIFRHFPLAHYGAEGQMAETTFVRMHDRQVPVELDLFTKTAVEKESFPTMRLQQGLVNYAIAMHSIWPTDYSPLVMMKVLAEFRWGEAATEDEKTRVELVKKWFNEVVRENSGRAVRCEPPLDYEQCRAKWTRVIELSFPRLAEAGGGGKGVKGGQGGQLQQNKGNGGGGQQGKAANRTPAVGGGLNTPPAAVSGVPCCYSFNQTAGCTREARGQNACKDKDGRVYSHYCNWWDNKAKKHCLKSHCRAKHH